GGGWGVRVEVTSKQAGESAVSRLLIQPATTKDSGRYTCSPANAQGHTVTVHVINSEKPAAIHHKNTTNSSTDGGGGAGTGTRTSGGSPRSLPPFSPLHLLLLALFPLLVWEGVHTRGSAGWTKGWIGKRRRNERMGDERKVWTAQYGSQNWYEGGCDVELKETLKGGLLLFDERKNKKKGWPEFTDLHHYPGLQGPNQQGIVDDTWSGEMLEEVQQVEVQQQQVQAVVHLRCSCISPGVDMVR
ncbi:hypothetical protein Pcinc_039808, partial [Petrolisthes cinctipes]